MTVVTFSCMELGSCTGGRPTESHRQEKDPWFRQEGLATHAYTTGLTNSGKLPLFALNVMEEVVLQGLLGPADSDAGTQPVLLGTRIGATKAQERT